VGVLRLRYDRSPLGRLGQTCSSSLTVGGAGGVAVAFLVSSPDLTAAQWLGILLFMQFLWFSIWTCVYIVVRRLSMPRWILILAFWFARSPAVGLFDRGVSGPRRSRTVTHLVVVGS
jgi:hypothetical protein